MNLTTEHLASAMHAAMALTNREDDRMVVPMKHVNGAMILNAIAVAILNGEFALVPREVMDESQAAEASVADFDPDDLKPGGTSSDD